MSECPAFYCSRCNISHADECPPALNKAYPPGYTIELKRISDQAFLDLMAAAPGARMKIVNGYSPTVGSKWITEVKINATDPWAHGSNNVTYEVTALGAVTATVKSAGVGFRIAYLYEHWYADGFDDGNGIRMRFVPAPP